MFDSEKLIWEGIGPTDFLAVACPLADYIWKPEKNVETRHRSVPGLEDNKGLPKNSITVIPAGSGPPCIFAISFLSNLGHMGQVTMNVMHYHPKDLFLLIVWIVNIFSDRESRCKKNHFRK